MTMTLTVAAIQMTSGAQVEANLYKAERLIARAAEQGAQLVALPENFAVFDSTALAREGELERLQNKFSSILADWGARYNVWLVGGTVPSRTRRPGSDEPVPGARVRTRCHVHAPDGQLVSYYDKLHLFDVDVPDAQGSYRESSTIEPGEQPAVAVTPWATIGLTICYDLRFPELFHALVLQGASIITVPAAFTYVTGEAHWLALLRARAIETQSYIIAPNQTGQNSRTRRTFGHSCIISPWGEILALSEQDETVVTAAIDLSQVEKLRRQMPVQQHKRFHVVGPRPQE